MLVMKFGGTSLGDGARVRRAAEIVLAAKARGDRPIVVASAHSGVTNLLFATAKAAIAGQDDGAAAITEKHRAILAELGLPEDLVEPQIEKLRRLLEGIRLLGELSPRSLDHIASFGERMSTRVLAAHLRDLGHEARAFPAWELGLTTTRQFGQARPLPEAAAVIKARVRGEVEGGLIPVITGYIGKSEDGCITTIGRNGSDYSAAIFGAAVGSEEIQIWTDVPGILTTDPRVVSDARPIKALSFSEAAELANYGAKVIHPATLLPAVEKSIPIRVKSTIEPDSPGSLILPESRRTDGVVKAIAHKSAITLVNIYSTRMLGRPGFLSKIAKVFQIHKIDIDMIATSEVSVSLTVENPSQLDAAVARLSRFAKVTVQRDRAIVCVVGEGLAESPGTIAHVFQALAGAGISVDLISQGASRINLGLVVDGARVSETVQALHDTLYPPPPAPSPS